MSGPTGTPFKQPKAVWAVAFACVSSRLGAKRTLITGLVLIVAFAAAAVLSTVHDALDAADRAEVIQPEYDDLDRAEREDAVQVAAGLGSVE
jgi:hypothetical protein